MGGTLMAHPCNCHIPLPLGLECPYSQVGLLDLEKIGTAEELASHLLPPNTLCNTLSSRQKLCRVIERKEGTCQWRFTVPQKVLPYEVQHRIAAAYVLEAGEQLARRKGSKIVFSVTCAGDAVSSGDCNLEGMLYSNCRGFWRRFSIEQSTELEDLTDVLHCTMQHAVLHDTMWGCYFHQCKFGIVAISTRAENDCLEDLGVVQGLIVVESRPMLDALPSAEELCTWMQGHPMQARPYTDNFVAVYDILAACIGEDIALLHEDSRGDEWGYRSQSYVLHRLTMCLVLLEDCSCMQDSLKELVRLLIVEWVGKKMQYRQDVSSSNKRKLGNAFL